MTNTNADSARALTPTQIYRKHEMEKKRNYNNRVMDIEQATFTPLIFSCTGGMGNESTTFFKMLASKLSDKSGEKYADITRWIRCKLSFIILRSCILCLRGTRVKKARENIDLVDNFNVACCEASI